MNKNQYIIGVDIGGTNTAVAVVDHLGSCHERTSFPTSDHNTVSGYIEYLASVISQCSKTIPDNSQLIGIGIGAPAARSISGIIQSPANLSIGTFNIVEKLQQYFPYPIAVTNDSNAAALGEMNYGLARGKKNFIAVTLGTGLGAGIVIDGSIVNGENETAGELGHTILEPNGRVCGCGRRGCVETYVSAPGLRRTASDLMALYTIDSECRNVKYADLNSEMIYRFAMKGDALAKKAFDMTGDYLGRMLANAAATLDPEVIILSGGLMKAGEMLLRPTMESFKRNVLFFHKEKVSILQSQFQEGENTIIGASCLISAMLHRSNGVTDRTTSSEIEMNY